jgi:hypothetical protein
MDSFNEAQNKEIPPTKYKPVIDCEEEVRRRRS